MSIIVLEGPEAAKAVGEALGRRPQDQRVGIDPDHVEFFQAEPF